MLAYKVDIQSPYPQKLPFSNKQIQTWALAAMSSLPKAEITVRFVTNEEMQTFNRSYRGFDKPTNVLAFPSEIPAHIKQTRPFLGDILIAPDVLNKEAIEQHKPLAAHWAHILIHGVLHLQGHTHDAPEPEAKMQALEKKYLAQFNYPDPYQPEHPCLDKS